MDRKKEIAEMVMKISGKYSAYEVFVDWIRCCAISISNSTDRYYGKVWQDREREYMDTARKYEQEEREMFSEMFCMLAETLESGMTDVIGEICMESGMGSKEAGQFFTPFYISRMCAKISLPVPDASGMYLINESSCGSGGMIIATAAALKEKGVNYQRHMQVIAQDLEWKSVYMCYLQLSLLGINAVVVQGDTLREPYINGYPQERVLYTPANKGLRIKGLN